MSENKNIYKGLECHCNKFEKIPIHRRELGMAGMWQLMGRLGVKYEYGN